MKIAGIFCFMYSYLYKLLVLILKKDFLLTDTTPTTCHHGRKTSDGIVFDYFRITFKKK